MRCFSTTARSAAGARHECVSRRLCRISLTRTHPGVRQCERMGGRPRRFKGIFSFDAKDGSCAVMCAACERGALVEPLALMKSADRLPIRQTRLDPQFACGVCLSPARDRHLPRTFPGPGGLSPSGTRLGRRRRCGGVGLRAGFHAQRRNRPRRMTERRELSCPVTRSAASPPHQRSNPVPPALPHGFGAMLLAMTSPTISRHLRDSALD
jgi:hypothetical protein